MLVYKERGPVDLRALDLLEGTQVRPQTKLFLALERPCQLR